MSKPPSIKVIRSLCVEDCDCLLWQGSFNRSGAPVRRYREDDGMSTTLQVRRYVWEHEHGPIPAGKVITYTCSNPACLEHLEMTTRAEVIRRQWQKPDIRARLVVAAKNSSRARAKINMDIARQIRESEETLEVVSARLGVSPTTASLIRRGIAWKETMANPFAGLGGTLG